METIHGTTPRRQLTERELDGYRQWIAELEEEARAEGSMGTCDPEVWEQFCPGSETGRQIYASFSDEELLDLLIRTMDRPGHKPRVEEIHCIYRAYLSLRFGGLHIAKERARARRKQLREREKWPWDWPERVSPQPLLEKLARRGRAANPEDRRLLEKLCKEARERGEPPKLTPDERRRLDRLGGCRTALELMGIPALTRAGARNMRLYWKEQRERLEAGASGPSGSGRNREQEEAP